jgi:copper oxidase (laccase) domain-containing protein
MSAETIDWDAPGPYRVAFSTRRGGVSGGAFASLNIGLATDDLPANVLENRRRLAAAVGADPARAAMAWQQHGARVERAHPVGILEPGTPLPRCDALWTDVPGQPMALVTADCLPVVIARAQGAKRRAADGGAGREGSSSASALDTTDAQAGAKRRAADGGAGREGSSSASALDTTQPALALLHVGWRGLLAGIVEAGCAALGPGALAAAVGPGIGPCCYEVGDDVAEPFRARFCPGVLDGRRLDLAGACESALVAAGCTGVTRVDRCTACEPETFFSHRRDRGRTGRQGVVGYVVDR